MIAGYISRELVRFSSLLNDYKDRESMIRIFSLAWLLLSFSFFLWPRVALAQNPVRCQPLDAEIRTRILRIVARSAHTEPIMPTIEEEKLVLDTCYWQLTLAVKNSNRRLTLYLAPDRHFVFSNLTDISVDPLLEDAKIAAQLSAHAKRDHAPETGPTSAQVEVVVFSDFQCPYCATFSQMIERWQKENAGRIRIVFRNLPLPVHEWAEPAARAGFCISRQSVPAFWKFHDLLFSKQNEINAERLPSVINQFLSGTTDLQSETFKECIASEFPQKHLAIDLEEARSFDVQAIPTVFINGRKYAGFRDDAGLAFAINLATTADQGDEMKK
jgi:protein-disulfide isomerase